MEPEEVRSRLNLRENAAVLECIDMYEVIRIHLSEVYIHLTEQILEDLD